MRTFNLLKYLSDRHTITLLTQRSEDVTDEEIQGLRDWVHELVVFPLPEAESGGNLASKLNRFQAFIQQGIPPNVRSRYSPDIQNWIDQAIDAKKFEVITCEHSVNEIYVRPEWQSVRRIVNIHSSVYGSCKNQLATGTSENWWRDRINLLLLRRYEQRYCAKFSAIVVTTAEDQQQLQALSPGKPVVVIPNGVDLVQFPYRSSDPGGHRLIFVGAMDSTHNIDAVRFFALDVMPKLRQRYPDITFSVVGARPTAEVLKLQECPGVLVTGRVESIATELHQATVCVVCLRTGFGIKNKTLEAMAAGVPVVGSDRGLEGLAVESEGVPLRALRANRVDEYIDAIVRLFEDGELRHQLSQRGRDLVETTFTWERAGQTYEQMLMQSGTA